MRMTEEKENDMIFSADVGGTKTYAAALSDDGAFRILQARRYANAAYADKGFGAIVKDFLVLSDAPKDQFSMAAVGAAGFVEDKRVSFPNMNWTVTEKEIETILNAPATIVNDLAAIASGIPLLAENEYALLTPGAKADDRFTKAVLAAGTGLGQAALIPHPKEKGWMPCPSEGGHVDFAPVNAEQTALLHYLLEREEYDGHVSYERVLSGPGLANIYTFLKDKRGGATEEPNDLKTATAAGRVNRIAELVSAHAQAKDDILCDCALDIFVSIYGAQAGNMALNHAALGGVYLAGGVAPDIIDRIKNGPFMDAFLKKGRFRSFLERVPVYVVLDRKIGLRGAAVLAKHGFSPIDCRPSQETILQTE